MQGNEEQALRKHTENTQKHTKEFKLIRRWILGKNIQCKLFPCTAAGCCG